MLFIAPGALNDEAEGGELAGPIAEHGLPCYSVGSPVEFILQWQ